MVWSHESGFLNRQNEQVMQGWHEFLQSLGDLKTTAKDFFEMVGVPIPDRFEHLAATIAEATPLYELCASVLEA